MGNWLANLNTAEDARLTGELQRLRDKQDAELQCLRAHQAEQDDQLQRLTARLQQERQERQSRQLMAPGHDALDTSQVIKSLPEVREAIASAMGKAVPSWMKNVDDTCYPQLILPQLFHQCLEEMKKHRQGIVEVFLGKVAGATEEGMDPKWAENMLEHMQRNYKTLFPLTTPSTTYTTERDEVLGRIFRGISTHINQTLGSPREPDHHVKRLRETGLEKVVDLYLEIIVNVLLLHPPVTFRGDCGDLIQKVDPALRGNDSDTQQFFDENIHSGSIDGGRGEDGQYIVIFPALLLQSGGEAWTKSYLLEVVPQQSSGEAQASPSERKLYSTEETPQGVVIPEGATSTDEVESSKADDENGFPPQGKTHSS
ncbi:unnamed protein product [Pylaiella littoralis]